jgi:hypothetical protein
VIFRSLLMTSDLESTASLLSADDLLALDEIAGQLERPDLSFEHRSELLQAIADMAEKYRCDPRLAES